MRYKILTVDDSKTVRLIVRKAFKPFDCEILEAANGVEGLAVAGKDSPDLIVLDVTMPVMDGVEMLTKLKSDPLLKSIPVIMLTAEGGRDNVLRIAKIGVRDYLVKPFKEEVLLEKAGRIIELKPLTDAPTKAKSIFDPATILVVEDKPAIVQQISDGLKNTPWKVHGVPTQGEAIDFCNRTPPDVIIASLSLPDDAAVTLFRLLRSQAKTKYTPVFGLIVKTEVTALQSAQQIGFTTVITKPIDMAELEGKIAKAMNLDTSQRYFAMESDCMVMRLPENSSPSVVGEVLGYLKGKLSEAVDAGHARAVFDVYKVNGLNMGVIKLLVQSMQQCQELGMQFALVGNTQIVTECKGFEETRGWTFFETLDQAKASLGRPVGTPAAPAAAAATVAA